MTFNNNYRVEDINYYFKRSLDFKKIESRKEIFKPLGLHYDVMSMYGDINELVNPYLKFIRPIKEFVRPLFVSGKTRFYLEDFECKPIINKKPQILFLTRLWDPDSTGVESELLRNERKLIDSSRIECIKMLKEQFGDSFIGGIYDSEFARKYHQEWL
jgi:hypothetical protein